MASPSARAAALLLCAAAFAAGCRARAVVRQPLPEERRLAGLRQLTFGGENAEAYFSGDDRELILQSTRPGVPCDQIFIMGVDGSRPRRVSTGLGRATCSYFYPQGDRILYSSTHLASPACPPKPDYRQGYVWPLYAGYDVFSAKRDGTDLRRLTDSPGYDAEATISPDGRRIVFTSVRDGDLELYAMDADGSNQTRLTHELGYDGGAFFSPDGRMLVFRASRPGTPAEVERYKSLLAAGLVAPTAMEIHVMNADGTGPRRVTANGAANFAPFFHPDGRRIIFASNMRDPKGHDFDLYLVNVDGSGLERVTFDPSFDGFPMFTRDGRRLVFASNRHGSRPGETNVFIAEWKD